MPVFLCRALADLTRQLTYAPAERVRQQSAHVEELFWQLEPDRSYPLDFLVFRITRFRPETLPPEMLAGAAVRRDLLTMVELLSEAVGDRADAYDPAPLQLEEVCRRLGVVPKTIGRYRRQGLFARRLLWPDGRTRLGFLSASLDRFVAWRGEKVAQAANFRRIDEPTQHAILMRARRIRARVDVSPFAVARHLSRRFGRSTEAVRQFLLRHDRHDPRVAIFPEHTPPLSDKDQRVIYRAYRRGVRVSRLAERFSRSRNVVYRAINLSRAAELCRLDIRCIANPTFDLPDAEQVILGGPIRPVGDEPIDQRTETALFARYNCLKSRALRLRNTLDRYHPQASALDAIETYLRRAAAVKEQLVRAFLRLVTTIARRHMAGARSTAMRSMADLIGEGSLVLLETLETFDPGRGNRYSTYLTWALMRRFARVGMERGPKTAAAIAAIPAATHDGEFVEPAEPSVARLLDRLNERERFVLTRHFGLRDESGERVQPQTLAQVAAHLEISAERARRIEHAALVKLREIAAQLDLSMTDLDALTHGSLQ